MHLPDRRLPAGRPTQRPDPRGIRREQTAFSKKRLHDHRHQRRPLQTPALPRPGRDIRERVRVAGSGGPFGNAGRVSQLPHRHRRLQHPRELRCRNLDFTGFSSRVTRAGDQRQARVTVTQIREHVVEIDSRCGRCTGIGDVLDDVLGEPVLDCRRLIAEHEAVIGQLLNKPGVRIVHDPPPHLHT